MCFVCIWLFLWLDYVWIMNVVGYGCSICDVLIWLVIYIKLWFIILFIVKGGFVVRVFGWNIEKVIVV